MIEVGKHFRSCSIALTSILLLALSGLPAMAHPACHAAAVIAATETNVPIEVLMEASDRHGTNSHPWTVIAGDTNLSFGTLEAAKSNVFHRFLRGERSFRLGCFGVEYRWAAEDFESIDAMFDPAASGLWLGRELARLKTIYRTWNAVLGAYHARVLHLAMDQIGDPGPDTSPRRG